mmetsp:Transcript_34457/g.74466  ORF Transcript_34457/g.74466 Transcript_34457/m.74466 type:complete len:81 (+) Transcript_34457:1656-1898(+)
MAASARSRQVEGSAAVCRRERPVASRVTSPQMTLLGLTSVDDNELKEIGVDAIGARKTLLAAAATLEPKDLLGAPQRSGW